jgi:hypothetical protein
MTKNRNMGRKSHRIQDVHFKQTAVGVDDQTGDQPTRPSLGKQQATKSSRLAPRNTK